MGEVIHLARIRLALRDLQREAVICLALANTGSALDGSPYAALAEITRRLHNALKRQETGDHDG